MGSNFVQFAGDLPAKMVKVEIVLVVLERIFTERGGIGLGETGQIYVHKTYISAPISRKPSKRNAANAVALHPSSAQHKRREKKHARNRQPLVRRIYLKR